MQHPELPASELLPPLRNPRPQVKQGPASKGSVRLNSWKSKSGPIRWEVGPVFAFSSGKQWGGVLEEGGRVEKADKKCPLYPSPVNFLFSSLYQCLLTELLINQGNACLRGRGRSRGTGRQGSELWVVWCCCPACLTERPHDSQDPASLPGSLPWHLVNS